MDINSDMFQTSNITDDILILSLSLCSLCKQWTPSIIIFMEK